MPIDLLEKVDQVVAETGTNRSTLIRKALEELVWQHWVQRGEEEEAAAFARQPQVEEEIAAGEDMACHAHTPAVQSSPTIDAADTLPASSAARPPDKLVSLLAIHRAITSQLDPQGVLQLIADEARRLTWARQAVVFPVEGEHMRAAVASPDRGSP